MTNGAVIFLLDRSYLVPFKVMMHSLRDALDNTKLDVVVLTDDDEIVKDHFVNRICDRVIKITDGQLASLKSIDLSSVPDDFRHPKYGVYWFLKFLVFDDYGYDFHVYMDTDMLCLDRSFLFEHLITPGAFSVGPTVGKNALGLEPSSRGQNNTEEEKAEVVAKTKRIASTDYAISRSINSGVMHITKQMIGRKVVVDLVKLASERAFRLEQHVLMAYAAETDGVSFKSMPLWFNFPELPLRSAGETNSVERLLPYAKILHFNLHPKPWRQGAKQNWVHDIWRRHHETSKTWVDTMSARPGLGERIAKWISARFPKGYRGGKLRPEVR